MVPGTSTSYLSSQNITTTSTVPTAKTASTVNIQTCRLENAEIVLVVLACIVTLIVLFFNGFILWKLTFMRCNRRKSRGNYDILLSYLSMFDLLSAVTMTARIYTELTRCSNSLSWPLGLVGCKTVLPLYDISINMSVCILIIISIDRCQRVMTPLKRTLKRKRIHVFVFISALVSFGVYFERFITAKVKHGMCGHVLEGLLSLSPLLVWVIRDIAFLVTFTTTSFCIQRSLRNRQFPLFTTNRHKKQSRSISRMLIFTQLVFTALVLPYDILSSISLGYGMFAKTSNKIAGLKPGVFFLLSKYLYLLQMSNSLANCFIYAKIHRLALPTQDTPETIKKRNLSGHSSTKLASPSSSKPFVSKEMQPTAPLKRLQDEPSDVSRML